MANDWTETRIPFDAGRRDVMVMRAAGSGKTQSVAYTGTAGTISNAVNSQIVRVWCSTDAFIVEGDNPTADTSGTPVAAKVAEYMIVTKPGTSKFSAVQQASGGTLYITECL